MLHVVAEYKVKEEKVKEFVTNAMALVSESESEVGCLMYKLVQKSGEPNTFTFIEIWRTDAALESHKRMPHYNEYVPMLEQASEVVNVSVYQALLVAYKAIEK